MTDRFIDNFTPGDGTDGLTWAKAELTAAAVDAADAAGDRWLFDYRHSESTPGAITLAVAGTNADPSQMISVTQSGASGASACTAGAIIATTATSGNNITVNGSFYAYGLTLKPGAGGGVNASISLAQTAGNIQTWDTSTFDLNTTGAGSSLSIGTSANQQQTEVLWKLCDLKFGATGHGINLSNKFRWDGGTVLSGTSTPSGALFRCTNSGEPAIGYITGVDFSNFSSGLNLVSVTAGPAGTVVFRNCKMPSGWNGSLITTPAIGMRAELYNCSASDQNYALWVEDYAGSIKHETTLVKTGGASDGTTPISWKMATSANAEYPAIILRSPEIQKWNETTGSAVTVTVDFLRDSATNLQDDEIWLEVEYLGTSGFPLSVFADDAAADVLATPADQATSAATWTTTGMSNPNEQKLSVTFTPQEKGLIIARVCMGVASTTVYVDPVLQVS